LNRTLGRRLVVATPLRAGRPVELPVAPVPGAGQEEIRRQNLGAVLRYVHVHGPTSRAELTSRLGLNRSTIGALAADLATAGLVTEEAEAPSATRRAGRPSLVVSPRSSRVCAHALSIEVDRLRAARIGLGGRILDQREARRPPGMPVLDAVAPLAALVREMDAAGEAPAVGGAVAVADTTRDGAGRIRIGAADDSLAAALDAEFAGGPGFVTGDLADIAALAEHVRGVAAGVNDLIYLHGDLGVSAGIITGGRLVTGHRGHSGKVGHMVVNPDGLHCGCGSRGCWETEVGEAALVRHSGRTERLEVLRAAAGGDPTARAAVRQVADWLGFGVANLVNVVNPDLVVFGGSLRELYAAGAGVVRRRLDGMALPASREHVQLRAAALGRNGALIGAAELAFAPVLADPLNAGVAG
jgi:predicted NBD/HSP70 family sugar kinase